MLRSVCSAALVLGCAGVTPTNALTAADYQFAVDLSPQQRAILWIPPTCQKIRGVIYGYQAVLEKFVFDDPKLREVASAAGLAILQARGMPGGYFEYNKPETPATLEKLLAACADASGYDELRDAPLFPIGHSGHAITCWNLAYWRPAKTIGMVSLHAAAINPPAWDTKAHTDGIPVLAVTGEWEMWIAGQNLASHIDWLRGGLLAMRGLRAGSLVSELVQPGAGHFNYDARLAAHVADFVRATCDLRLPPADAPTGAPLRTIEPAQGWLGDVSLTREPRVPFARYDAFTGDPALAFWYPSADLAQRAEAYAALNRGRKPQMLSFVEEGKILPAQWIVGLKPIVQDDGETIRVEARFIDRWPEKQQGGGTPIGHARSGAISYQWIGSWTGAGAQTGPDTFRVEYNHWGINNGIMLMASHPGDAEYGYTEMAASISFPDRWKDGPAQTISFPEIPNQPRSSAGVTLGATSSAGLTVRYSVKTGPARIEGNRLVFTPLPPRTTKPVPVTVIAWQRGRPNPPQVQTATPIERTFLYGDPAKP